MSKKTSALDAQGGPAYPCTFSEGAGSLAFTETIYSGMTLRDWFAGQALAGITQDSDCFWPGAAPLAYQYADAMLALRKNNPPSDGGS